jgi:hypothetical protein
MSSLAANSLTLIFLSANNCLMILDPAIAISPFLILVIDYNNMKNK